MSPRHHDLKIRPHYFEAVIEGQKTFEIRENDRDFQSGDTVNLVEQYFVRGHGSVTGRECSAEIGYITDYEQQPGYVVFSLLKVKQTK